MVLFRNGILPAAVALGSAVFLLVAPAARACSCSFRPLCDHIEFADVVLRGSVLRRTEPEDQFGDDVSYEIRVNTLFQTEEGADYPEDITIVTPADAARCGIYLEVGNEYLLDFIRDEDDLRSVGACGATQSWTSLDKDKIATLEDVDSACAVEVVEDPCEGRCPDSYECLFYTGDIAEDQYYCSAVCDPSPCDEGEECSLTAVGCSPGSIFCGNGYVCSSVDSDDVEAVQEAIIEDCSECGEFQDCLVWSSDDSEENYCADVCDPSPCAGDDTCSLEDQDGCDTTASPCPPVATCTASLVPADQEVEIDEEAQDTSSALHLAAGSSTAAAVLMVTLLL